MFMDAFFDSHGVTMQIERNEKIVAEAIGLPNHEKATGKAYIGFRSGTDIRTGDVIINPAKDRLRVVHIENSYFHKQVQQNKVFYQSEQEYLLKQSQQSSTVFNIGTAYGSVIGNYNTATTNYQTCLSELHTRVAAESSPDKEQMEKLINLVEMIVNDQIPVQKGILSKFSSLMERHTWLSGSVASTLLGWLIQSLQ